MKNKGFKGKAKFITRVYSIDRVRRDLICKQMSYILNVRNILTC